MRAYKVETADGFEATIFGDSYDEAATLFCVHYEVYVGKMPDEFTVAMVRRPKPGRRRNHLDNAIAKRLSGVGYYMAGPGWTIVPAERIVTLQEDVLEWPGSTAANE